MNSAERMLALGSGLLEPLFLRHGFTYTELGAGNSSGGQFAYGEFRRGTRSLQFHFRHSLGMVTYHLGSRSMSHKEYMRSVLGRPNAGQYPGFSSDPLQAFRDLSLDLEQHGLDFLEGSDDSVLRHIENAEAHTGGGSKLPA